MSNAQLVYFPMPCKNSTIYYPLDAVTDVDALLFLKKNPFTNETLTDTQITFLENSKANHKYPRIAVGDFFEEVDERLLSSGTQYTEKEYQRKTRELVSLIENTDILVYESAQVYNFATDYILSQYNLFLRHKPINQKILNCSRDDASAQTLNYIINYLFIQQQKGPDEGKIAIINMAYAIDEFIYLIRNSLTYEELLQKRGLANELYWKPNFIEETHYLSGNLKCQYYIDENNDKHGSYIEWYDNNNIAYQSTYHHGVESNIRRYYGTGEKALEDNVYYYPTGVTLAIPKDDNFELFDENGNSLGLGKLHNHIFKNNQGIVGCQLDFNGNLIDCFVSYQNNLKHGFSIKWYNSGHLKEKSYFINDKIHGVNEGWHTNGKLHFRKYYKLGMEIDLYQIFYTNSNLYLTGWFDEGNKLGFWHTWHNNGQLQREEFYYNNKINGSIRDWHENGTLQSEGIMVDGDQVDLWQYWHSNGVLAKRKSFIKDGINHGWYYTWNDKGDLTTEGYYDQGKKHGQWETHYDNGQLYTQEYYEFGDKHGLQLAYHLNKQLILKTSFNYGVLQHSQSWYSNSQLTSEFFYEDGVQYGLQREWYSNGMLETECYTYGGKKFGLYQTWNDGGKLQDSGLYLDDKKTGLWMHTEYQGTSYGEYLNDKKMGLWRTFIGSILIYEKMYHDRCEHGWQTKYYPNGNIFFTGEYAYNQPIGPWKYYYPNGYIAGSGNYTYNNPKFSVWDPYGKYIGERFIERGFGIMFKDINKDGLCVTTSNGFPKVNYYLNNVCQSYEVYWQWDGDNLICIQNN